MEARYRRKKKKICCICRCRRLTSLVLLRWLYWYCGQPAHHLHCLSALEPYPCSLTACHCMPDLCKGKRFWCTVKDIQISLDFWERFAELAVVPYYKRIITPHPWSSSSIIFSCRMSISFPFYERTISHVLLSHLPVTSSLQEVEFTDKLSCHILFCPFSLVVCSVCSFDELTMNQHWYKMYQYKQHQGFCHFLLLFCLVSYFIMIFRDNSVIVIYGGREI